MTTWRVLWAAEVIVIFKAKFLNLFQLFLISINHLMITAWDFEIKDDKAY